MKNRFETTPDDSPLSKRGSFSNSYASRYYPASDQKPKRSLSRENSQTFAYASNSRLETSFQQNTDPSPLERGSRASLSPHKGIIHWGVSSSEDVYQTTYKNCYETHDKINAAPKKRDPHTYPRQLSGSLIPHNVTETKRIQKDGDHNYSASRRLPTEDDTFFDRIGERKQPSPDRGRAHLTEPRVEDPALRTQHRFYRPVEQTHGESSRNMSASRLIKQVLDFCPPQSIVPGGGFVTRNIESLAFSGDVDHPDTVQANKIGSGYSRVEKKIKEEVFRGKKQYNKSMSENEMKTILAHKDLYKKDFVPIETTKMLKSMKASKPKPEGNSYQSIHFKRTMTSLGLTQQKVDRSLSNVRLETEPVQRKGSLTAYESGREREGSVKKEPTITFDPRRWSVNENKQLMTPSKDPNMNTFLKSISKTAGKSPTRDRSRSGSVKSLRGDASRKSVGGFDVADREKSQDKNSFMVVSHEKKKPTRGGTFKNPILSNNSGKKTLRASTETFTAFKKNNILNY